ncbi:DUF6690 family protein [Aureliella helgolandensis]|uniref:DUF6690 domain-containing protein n=1 Tax=Aureliella helgolandensis TaxID=2527968 RepID=A0A518G6N5_9BACT|nr:DUF6690 family protein [Aureliella helgolandensis]QDV24253.1 hypothetical protein Q31a_25680 [Aureliella helgolandensis]
MSNTFLKRPLTGLLVLAGAAGGPYMLFETDVGSQARQAATGIVSTSDAPPPPGRLTSASHSNSQDPYYGLTGNDPRLNPLNPSDTLQDVVYPPVLALQQVLRFDVSPGWVTQQFPRITTVLADMQLDGLRVPLVTGTTPGDIAGTLTYYFDRYKRLQRIKLEGVAGDPSRFVAELQQIYKLEQSPSLGGGLYVLKWNGHPTSVMHVAPAPVIHADSPYSRFNVFLELNLPGLEYGLSVDAEQFIRAGQATQRW